jgi:hypothetical protein
MKFLLQLTAIVVLAYIFELFLPWYYIAVAAFIGGYVLKSKANFLAGFLAIALLWIVKAWLADSGSPSDLTIRVANIFTLPRKEILYGVTALIGGLVGGFAALTGSLLKRKVKLV